MEIITLESLKNHLGFFEKMYNSVRLVDPIRKRVLEFTTNNVNEIDEVCYHYWSDKKICDNCISVRAHLQNKIFIKLEISDCDTMLVTAIPIENAEKPAVLELLINATETMMIGTGTYSDGYMIHNYIKELNELVLKDSLTGIYNRRFADEHLPADIVKSLVSRQPLSIIFLDINNLKAVNDTLGHAFGDRIIQSVASVLSLCIRTEKDWVARYGGDEFLICLSSTEAQYAERIYTRIREKLTELASKDELGIKVSVSAGIHTMDGTPLTAKELIAEADKKMYIAKMKYKNNYE